MLSHTSASPLAASLKALRWFTNPATTFRQPEDNQTDLQQDGAKQNPNVQKEPREQTVAKSCTDPPWTGCSGGLFATRDQARVTSFMLPFGLGSCVGMVWIADHGT